MTKFHWFLPTGGDGRTIVGGGHGAGRRGVRRPPDIEYLAQIARSAEQLGFEGVLTPTGTQCEDAWLTTAALTRETERLKFLVAFRPGFLSPTLLAILRDALGGEPHDFTGDYYDVEGATVSQAPAPVPQVYFGGSSSAAGPVAAGHADVYLTWGEPPPQVERLIGWMREPAEREGRRLRFGIRLHVVTRDTAKEAWAVARRLLDDLDPAEITRAQEGLARSESVGQARMRSLHADFRGGGSSHDPEIYPNLWAGVGLVRGGAGTALVGSHAQVAERIAEYASLGVDEFIFSGYPHLEEAYWFGEGVLPELNRLGLREAAA